MLVNSCLMMCSRWHTVAHVSQKFYVHLFQPTFCCFSETRNNRAIIFIEKLATSKVNLRVDLRMVNETYFQRARVHDNIILIEKEELAAIK